jgi:hypothetical protein
MNDTGGLSSTAMIRIAATPAASIEQTSPTVETSASIAEISGAILMQRPSGEQECRSKAASVLVGCEGGSIGILTEERTSHWFKQQKLEDAHG